MSAEKLEAKLLKPIWTIHDVMEYMDCKETKARRLMKLCRSKYRGGTPTGTANVLRDSFLAMIGTSVENEVSNLSAIMQVKTDAQPLSIYLPRIEGETVFSSAKKA